MPTDLATHRAPRPEPMPKLELPPIVRDYLDNVRGAPEMNRSLAPGYLDSLWWHATDFAKRNGVNCPVHKEEVDALRDFIEQQAPDAPARAKFAAPRTGWGRGWRH